MARRLADINALIFFAFRALALATIDFPSTLSRIQLRSKTRQDQWCTSEKSGERDRCIEPVKPHATSLMQLPLTRWMGRSSRTCALSRCDDRLYRGHLATVATPNPCAQRDIALNEALSSVFRWHKLRRCIFKYRKADLTVA